METQFQSELLDAAVTELSRLPGIGGKTALRLALHLLRCDTSVSDALGNAIINLRHGIRYCSVCHNISQEEVCPICASTSRDASVVCVVENVRDVISFENTGRFNGLYHVLGGVISPVDGIGPDRLEIDSLIERVAKGNVREVILALGATMDGDTTNYYIYRRLAALGTDTTITQLARGVSVGNEIEYTDEITLGRSLEGRVPFNTGF
ncbi:MAG: recombination protein RecR [Muribaculaceae bacterium]|nr:recombination protein RecR [Muribaculaceae bacterium]